MYRLADDAAHDPATEHALRSRAAGPGLASDAAFGFATAAVLLRLPLWKIPLQRLHVIRDRSYGGRLRGDVHIHAGRLPPDDVLTVDGIRVTTPARTVVDMARTLPVPKALVPLDGALHRAVVAARTRSPDPGAATPDEVDRIIERAAGTPGAATARRAIALADGLSESPGETLSRYRMLASGLPVPLLQWSVPTTRHRTDFAWPGRGVVGEFDGRIKYGRALRRGQNLEDVLWEEKLREDQIRATGLTVVRWTWKDIESTTTDGMLPRLRFVLSR
ncbi:hypothetical protein WIS52_11920 [Pseudonocardia nematodicida]|uniref:Transcriptional regulator, AbiEi antitoxin, Type IV TA system n=1 Tax=Pseudonocardia nematodicida TaxID=1206997 RepID=A0ABV1KCU8_9PSEU